MRSLSIVGKKICIWSPMVLTWLVSSVVYSQNLCDVSIVSPERKILFKIFENGKFLPDNGTYEHRLGEKNIHSFWPRTLPMHSYECQVQTNKDGIINRLWWWSEGMPFTGITETNYFFGVRNGRCYLREIRYNKNVAVNTDMCHELKVELEKNKKDTETLESLLKEIFVHYNVKISSSPVEEAEKQLAKCKEHKAILAALNDSKLWLSSGTDNSTSSEPQPNR